MGLVLGLRKDENFYVGTHRFVVARVNAENDFVLRDGETGEEFSIVGDYETEILPDVWVSTGGRQELSLARVSIVAPRSIRISRGDAHGPIQETRRRA